MRGACEEVQTFLGKLARGGKTRHRWSEEIERVCKCVQWVEERKKKKSARDVNDVMANQCVRIR